MDLLKRLKIVLVSISILVPEKLELSKECGHRIVFLNLAEIWNKSYRKLWGKLVSF